MRTSIIGISVVALVATGAYAVINGNLCGGSHARNMQARAGNVSSLATSNTSCDAAQGDIAGHFDPAMSGVCRFSCGTKSKYDARDVLAQPGAEAGKLTQCPVSGVVFAVDQDRPRVRVGNDEYVTCCDKCATKLTHDPGHYLKL